MLLLQYQPSIMKHTVLVVTFFFLYIFRFEGFAQSILPESGVLYTLESVPRIDILIPPDTLTQIYENPESDREFRATFIFNSNQAHDTIKEVGFRLRGNTSRVAMKKSFKVSFNTFVDKRKYHGVEKLDLNGEHNDPSSSRSVLYWYMLRKANVVGSRANHVQVYINGNYYGLYTNVEHIDEEFVKTYYDNDDGNLYKCLWPADLTYHGTNQNNYKFMNGDYRVYDLKTNEEADNYTDLVELINVINNTPMTEFPCKLEEVFNVQGYLKIAALDVLTSNWDGYAFNKNNFYLYHNPATGLFEYIPYDVDNTFGIDWFNIDWATRNIYNWASSEPRPLFKKLMQVPDYKAQYTYYIKQLINEVINDQAFVQFKNELKTQSAAYLINDPYYPLDYGYDMSSYERSWTSEVDDHVPYGINEFLQKRKTTALTQCSSSNPKPVIAMITNNLPEPKEDLLITAFVEGADLQSVEVNFSMNGGDLMSAIMNDEGINGDSKASDQIYTVLLPGFPGGTKIEYTIKAISAFDTETIRPCIPKSYQFPIDENAPFSFWPNPSYGDKVYFSKATGFKLYDITGRLIAESQNASVIDVSFFNPGIGLLRTTDGKLYKLIISR